MGTLINLADFKKKKNADKDSIVQAMKDSLNNDVVKRRYKLNVPPPPPTEEERVARIRESVQRVNSLLSELHDNTKGDKK